jgi:hypothetical protein
MRPHVVILTGGAVPDAPAPDPASAELNAVRDEMAAAVADLGLNGLEPAGREHALALLTALAASGWRAGWRKAVILHRPVAVYVIDDDCEAKRFADFMTAEVDPAYVIASSSPMTELLASCEETTGRRIR